MKKVILITVSIIILVSMLVVAVFYKLNIDNKNEQQRLYNYYYDNDNEYELIQRVCEKNGNWKNYPLTKHFRAKYNEKDGIFGNMQFDKVEVNPFKEGEYHFSYTSHIVVTQGLKKTVYIFYQKHSKYNSLSDSRYEPGLEDIVITDIINLTDENGNKLDDRYVFTNDKKVKLLYHISDVNKDLNDGVAVTDKFHKKYPIFLDLFIHYSPLSYNRIKFIEQESDLENNIAIFEVDSILECKKRKYKVKLILDDKLYLDDCEVELLEETAYEGDHKNSSAKAFYLHSNLENTTLTDEFIERLKAKGSYFDDIDNIDIDYIVDEAFVKNNDTDIIRCYKMKDGTINSYYVKYNYNDNNKISNIIPIKLEYTNISAEEVAKLYLDSIKETKKE